MKNGNYCILKAVGYDAKQLILFFGIQTHLKNLAKQTFCKILLRSVI